MKHARPPHLQDGAVGALITSLVERLQRCQLVPVDRCGRANFEPFVGALSAAQFTLNDEQKWAKGAPLSLLSSDAKFKVIRPSVRRLIDSASRVLPSARSGSQLFSARCLCVCAFKTQKKYFHWLNDEKTAKMSVIYENAALEPKICRWRIIERQRTETSSGRISSTLGGFTSSGKIYLKPPIGSLAWIIDAASADDCSDIRRI